jgi:hypothetical protein
MVNGNPKVPVSPQLPFGHMRGSNRIIGRRGENVKGQSGGLH